MNKNMVLGDIINTLGFDNENLKIMNNDWCFVILSETSSIGFLFKSNEICIHHQDVGSEYFYLNEDTFLDIYCAWVASTVFKFEIFKPYSKINGIKNGFIDGLVSKLDTIKEIRQYLNIDLKNAKDIVNTWE